MCCPVKSFTKIFQLIVFLKGFREEERKKLAQIYGIFFANPLQPSATLGNPQCLNAVFEDHLVKEGRYPSTEDCSANRRALSIECSGGVISTFRRVCKIRQTRWTCPAKISNVQRRTHDSPDKMSGETQKTFCILCFSHHSHRHFLFS